MADAMIDFMDVAFICMLLFFSETQHRQEAIISLGRS